MRVGPRGIRVAAMPEGKAARPTPRCPARSHLTGLGRLVSSPSSAAGPERKHPGTSVPAPQINGTRFGNHRFGRWPIPGVLCRPQHSTRRLTLAGRVLRHPRPALPRRKRDSPKMARRSSRHFGRPRGVRCGGAKGGQHVTYTGMLWDPRWDISPFAVALRDTLSR